MEMSRWSSLFSHSLRLGESQQAKVSCSPPHSEVWTSGGKTLYHKMLQNKEIFSTSQPYFRKKNITQTKLNVVYY